MMLQNPATTTLRAALELLCPGGVMTPERWTQWRYSSNAQGRDTAPNSGGAVCWCVVGSFSRVGNRDGKVYDIINTITGYPSVSAWNDSPTTTYDDVIRVLREALARAQTEETGPLP